MPPIIPTLRKNRRLESRWGQQYYTALKDAVFTFKHNVIDVEVANSHPGSSEAQKKGHKCEQCGDSFHFQQSLDEHTARFSWILGYWCHQCSIVDCDHIPGAERCQVCSTLYKKKLDYLRARGLKKGVRPGKITLFYNQCQFFDHLSKHGIKAVEMSDIMLMPLPHNISRNEYASLDFVAKGLMECMFIKRIHIMDWLRLRNIDFKWWTCKADETNSVSELLRIYSPDCLLKNNCIVEPEPEASMSDDSLSEPTFQQTNVTHTYGGAGKKSVAHVAPLQGERKKSCDTPEIVLDISDNSLNECSKPQDDGSAIVEGDDPLKEDFIDFEIIETTETNSSETVATTIDSESTQNTLGNDNFVDISQRLTVKTPAQLGLVGYSLENKEKKDKDTSLGSKIDAKNLPALSMKNKTIIIINRGGEKNSNLPALSPIQNNNIVAIKGQNASVPKMIVTKNLTPIKPKKINESLNVPISADRRIVLPSGAKVILRPMQKPPADVLNNPKNTVIPLVSNLTKLPNGENILSATVVSKKPELIEIPSSNNNPENTVEVNVHAQPFTINPPNVRYRSIINANLTDTTFLLFWQSIQKHPYDVTYNNTKQHGRETLRVDIQGKCAFLQKQAVDEKYIQHKKTKHLSMDDRKNLVAAYRKQVLADIKLDRYDKPQILVDDLKIVSLAYATAKCPDMVPILDFNISSLKVFEKYISKSRAEDRIESHVLDAFDVKLRSWETEITEPLQPCSKCSQKLYPSSYMPGLSVPAKNVSDYCSCSNYICHICSSRQGLSERYNAHLKLHKKEMPFKCPECFEDFSTIYLLEQHIWTRCFHIITQRVFSCSVCAIRGFLTMEDVARHYARAHAKSAVVCPKCNMLLSTYTSYRIHFARAHGQDLVVNPDRLIICDLGQCLVRPEYFCAHLEEHQELNKENYFTCPFCPFAIKNVFSNREKIQRHVFQTHTLRLHEVITRETLLHFMHEYKLSIPISMASCVFVSPADESNIVIPKIVNTCSIDQMAFESSGNDGQNKIDSTLDQSEKIPEKLVRPRNARVPLIIKPGSTQISGQLDITTDKNEPRVPMIVNIVSGNDVSEELSAKNVIEHVDDTLTSFSQLKESEIIDESPSEIPDFTKYTEVSFLKVDTDAIKRSAALKNHKNDHLPLEKSSTEDFTVREKEDSPVNDVTGCELIEENSQSLITVGEVPKNIMTNIQMSLRRKRTRTKPWRIALNSGNNSTDTPINYKCHLCSEIINTSWSIIKNHFIHCHAGDYKVSVLSPCVPRVETMKMEGKSDGRKRKMDSNCTTPPKKRRRCVNKKIPDKSFSSNLGICVEQESLQDIEGSIKCKKCNELFDNVNILRQHVATSHRIRQHFLVCLECGENFIVAPSLQMHLKAFHGINDPIEYLAQHTEYAPDIIEELEEKITESNQCHVCRAVFEDKATVDKHLRVHGMAFLNRKRIEARNALKSPEKNAQLSHSSTAKPHEDPPKKDSDKNSDCDKDNQTSELRIVSIYSERHSP